MPIGGRVPICGDAEARASIRAARVVKVLTSCIVDVDVGCKSSSIRGDDRNLNGLVTTRVCLIWLDRLDLLLEQIARLM